MDRSPRLRRSMSPLLLLVLASVFTLVRAGDHIGYYISSGSGGKCGMCVRCDQFANVEVYSSWHGSRVLPSGHRGIARIMEHS